VSAVTSKRFSTGHMFPTIWRDGEDERDPDVYEMTVMSVMSLEQHAGRALHIA